LNVTMRSEPAIRNAINSIFYIKQHTDRQTLKEECQKMINILFKEFPNVMPKPQDESFIN